MSINLNVATPAAPAGTVNGTGQVDVSGNVSVNVSQSAVELTANQVSLTAQAAIIGTTTILTTSASVLFLISVDIIVTTVGSISSTLPKVTISWTDANNSQSQSVDITPTNAGNLLTTLQQADMFFSALTGTNISYATSGYASNAAGMQYALHIVTEKL